MLRPALQISIRSGFRISVELGDCALYLDARSGFDEFGVLESGLEVFGQDLQVFPEGLVVCVDLE